MLICFRYITLVAVILANTISHANALSSDGSRGALLVNNEVRLKVMDSQVLNFTTIDINPGGVLHIFNEVQNISFSLLASGDINIAGILNIYSNTIIESAGNISITGIIDIKNQSTLTLASNSIVINSGSLYFDGLPINSTNGEDIKIPSMPLLINSPVPEPSSYALLISGIALIILARRNTLN